MKDIDLKSAFSSRELATMLFALKHFNLNETDCDEQEKAKLKKARDALFSAIFMCGGKTYIRDNDLRHLDMVISEYDVWNGGYNAKDVTFFLNLIEEGINGFWLLEIVSMCGIYELGVSHKNISKYVEKAKKAGVKTEKAFMKWLNAEKEKINKQQKGNKK